MIVNVKISNSVSRVSVMTDDSTLIADLLSQNSIDPSAGQLFLNGMALGADWTSRTLRDYEVGEVNYISCLANKNNAVQVIAVGSTAVFRIDVTNAELQRLADQNNGMSYANEEQEFGVTIRDGENSVNSKGIVFPGGNATEKAAVSVALPSDITDRKEYIAKKYAKVITKLSLAESEMADELAGLDELEAAVRGTIVEL